MIKMLPWYRGFRGSIKVSNTNDTTYIVEGKIEEGLKKNLIITELPVGKWTEDYRRFLNRASKLKDIEGYEDQ